MRTKVLLILLTILSSILRATGENSPYRENLLANPDASEGISGWNTYLFSVTDNTWKAGNQAGTMFQEINLEVSGLPDPDTETPLFANISIDAAAEFGYRIFKAYIEMKDDGGRIIGTAFLINNTSSIFITAPWKTYAKPIQLTDGTKSITFRMEGQDYLNLPGAYGPAFKNAWLSVAPPDLAKQALSVTTGTPSEGSVTGGGFYDFGSSCTIKAIPAEGYMFDKWSDGNNDNPRNILLIKDVTLTASFLSAEPFEIIIDPTIGTISGGDEKKSVIYSQPYGTLPVATTDNPNISFDGWMCDGIRITEETIVQKREPHTLTAAWKLKDGIPQFPVNNAGDISVFAYLVNSGNTSLNARLTSDIDLSGKGNLNIGTETSPYGGTFDGGSHNIKVDYNGSEDYLALFSHVSGAVIKNLHVSGFIISGGKYAGGIAGQHLSGTLTVEKCITDVSIALTYGGETFCGGIVGISESGTITDITDCAVLGSFSGTTYPIDGIGGFVGWINGNCNIKNSFNAASLTNAKYIGSENFSRNGGVITNCYYLNKFTSSVQGTQKDTGAFSNGEIAYLLGSSWGQIIGNNIFPEFILADESNRVFKVSATAADSGQGSVTGSGYYQKGTNVTLTAKCNTDGMSIIWKDPYGNRISISNPYIINSLDKDLTLKADFASAGGIKEINSDYTETENTIYTDVTIEKGEGSTPVWNIGNYNITSDNLEINVGPDGDIPQIALTTGTLNTMSVSVNRMVKSGQWTLMALPFGINLNDITVNGVPAKYDVNIKLQYYDAAYRAANSRENWTVSGWKDKNNGNISANQGFAVAVNANNGSEQIVSFRAENIIFNGADKTINLERHYSTVNKGADADWNFYGNPTLQNSYKGEGYSLYIYNTTNNSYIEYSSVETATYIPFTSWFVQSADDFTSMAFRHGYTVDKTIRAIESYERLELSINGGEDDVKIFIKNESSMEYVKNEDAMYFAPPNNNISQIYLIDQNGDKIASSVVPSAYESVKIAYKAAKEGIQTITLSSIIANTIVTLKDNVTGKETDLKEGGSYQFDSVAGLNENRFILKTKTTTGTTSVNQTNSIQDNISIAIEGDLINITGTSKGESIRLFNIAGNEIADVTGSEGCTTICTNAKGILIIKVGAVAIKITK